MPNRSARVAVDYVYTVFYLDRADTPYLEAVCTTLHKAKAVRPGKWYKVHGENMWRQFIPSTLGWYQIDLAPLNQELAN